MFAIRDKPRLPASAIALAAVGFAALVALAIGLAALEGAHASKPDKPDLPPGLAQKPNIIVITTDDQTVAQLNESTMPTVMSQLAAQGTTFTNMIATTPLCCPSRATFLTGQYMHNNGVTSNRPGYESLVRKRAVLPAWLQKAGYVTAHVGKYLNRYGKSVRPDSTPAPGWDEWVAALEPRSYFDYELQVNGRTVKYGSDDPDYLTRVFNWRAVKLIHKYVPRKQPLFLSIDQFAPHERGAGDPAERCAGGAIPDPLDNQLFDGVPLPQPPNYNETDVSDKPSFIQDLPDISEEERLDIERRWGCALASLVAVDRGLSQIIAELQNDGELDNTVIMFWSDNGFFYGEHRIPAEKTIPYEEALEVPMIWRVPSQYLGDTTQARTASSLVGNIDIAPTILDLADAQPCLGKAATNCRIMDGRSLLGLMTGDTTGFGPDRTLLIEQGVCGYRGVRDLTEVYIEHLGTRIENTETCNPELEIEHYDLGADPFELKNLYPATSNGVLEAQGRLFDELSELRDCSGVEGRDPAPPSGHYCQ